MRKPIYLEWCDAVSNAGWFEVNELDEWAESSSWVIKECGWLVKETKDYLVFANGYKPADDWVDEKFVGLHKIPKTWILRRVDLARAIK